MSYLVFYMGEKEDEERWQTVSDYISKSSMAKAIENHYNGLTHENVPQSIPDFYSQMAQLVENQPTIDEKEIIRKPMERIIEMLEEERKYSYENFKDEERAWRKGLRTAIKIVKEEGGIDG